MISDNSEDESELEWLHQEMKQKIHNDENLNEGKKWTTMLWNIHMMKNGSQKEEEIRGEKEQEIQSQLKLIESLRRGPNCVQTSLTLLSLHLNHLVSRP